MYVPLTTFVSKLFSQKVFVNCVEAVVVEVPPSAIAQLPTSKTVPSPSHHSPISANITCALTEHNTIDNYN